MRRLFGIDETLDGKITGPGGVIELPANGPQLLVGDPEVLEREGTLLGKSGFWIVHDRGSLSRFGRSWRKTKSPVFFCQCQWPGPGPSNVFIDADARAHENPGAQQQSRGGDEKEQPPT